MGDEPVEVLWEEEEEEQEEQASGYNVNQTTPDGQTALMLAGKRVH